MSVQHPPEEIARRALPWYLLPKFRNVVTSFAVEEVGEKVIPLRELEVYVSDFGSIYVPGASAFLYVPNIAFGKEIDKDNKVIRLKDIKGWIQGFSPDGQYTKILMDTVVQEEPFPEIKYEESYTDFAVNILARNIARIRAGKYFASSVAHKLRRYGLAVEPTKLALEVREIILEESGLRASVTMLTGLHKVHYGTETVTAPGIVPAILSLIDRGIFDPLEKANPEAKQVLTDFLDSMTSIGKRVSTISILQRTSKTRFSYYIGELDIPESVKREYSSRRYIWLFGKLIHKGVKANIVADVVTEKAILSLSILPFNPPATIVLNYPPFNVAPLSAAYNERYPVIQYLTGVAKERAERLGFKVAFFNEDLRALADAGVKFDEVRRILMDGYARLNHLSTVMEKIEKLGTIADIMSFALGPAQRVDKMLVTVLTREVLKREKKEVAEEAEQEVEEKELEEITL